MSTVTFGELAHAVMGVDWHGWLLLFSVLAACWMLAVLITTTLVGGSARSSRPDTARTPADHATAGNSPASHTRNRRHV